MTSAFELGRIDARPLYVQATEAIEQLITDSGLDIGDRLPSEAALAERLRVSRNTIREGLRELEVRGRIVRMHGRGTVIAARPPIHTWLTALESLESLARKQGWRCGTEAVEIKEVIGPPHAAAALGVSDREPLTYIARVKTKDWQPVSHMTTWIPTSVIDPEELRRRFNNSVTEVLLDTAGVELDRAEAEVGAWAANAAVAAALRVPEGSPLVWLAELCIGRGDRPVGYTDILFVPKAVQLGVIRRPVRIPGG